MTAKGLLNGPRSRSSQGHGRSSGTGSTLCIVCATVAVVVAAIPLAIAASRVLFAFSVVASAKALPFELDVIVDQPWFRDPRPDLLHPSASEEWPIPKLLHSVPPPPPQPPPGTPRAPAARDDGGGGSGDGGPAPVSDAAAGCRRLHPDWSFRSWGEEEGRRLLSERYPWALEAYDSYRHPAQRVYALRLFILHAFGGVLIQNDIGCQHRLDALRQFDALLLPLAPRFSGGGGAFVSSSVMASPPGHGFLSLVTRELPRYNHNYAGYGLTVLMSSGDLMLSHQVKAWVERNNSSSSSGTAASGSGAKSGGKQAGGDDDDDVADDDVVFGIPASLFRSKSPGRALFAHGLQWEGARVSGGAPGAHAPSAAEWMGAPLAAAQGGGAAGAGLGAAAAAPAVTAAGAGSMGAVAKLRRRPPPPLPAREWRHWDATLALWISDDPGWAMLMVLCSFVAGILAAWWLPGLSCVMLNATAERHDRMD